MIDTPRQQFMAQNRTDWSPEQWAQFNAEQRKAVFADMPRAIKRAREMQQRADKVRAGLATGKK